MVQPRRLSCAPCWPEGGRQRRRGSRDPARHPSLPHPRDTPVDKTRAHVREPRNTARYTIVGVGSGCPRDKVRRRSGCHDAGAAGSRGQSPGCCPHPSRRWTASSGEDPAPPAAEVAKPRGPAGLFLLLPSGSRVWPCSEKAMAWLSSEWKTSSLSAVQRSPGVHLEMQTPR